MRHYKIVFETPNRGCLLILEQDRVCMGRDFLDACVRWMYILAEDYPQEMSNIIRAHISVDGVEFATVYASTHTFISSTHLTIHLVYDPKQRVCCLRCSELYDHPAERGFFFQ